MCLFIWLPCVIVVACGVFAALLFGAWTSAVGQGLGFFTACGLLLPQPETEPASSALEGGFLIAGP